jgi:hypothetical protein
MVCVSIILAHMLASLDCVSRQECWEPLLPKHLQHVFYHHREDNHQSIDVQTLTTECQIHQRTKTTWELIDDMKASSPLINHMLPHDQQERTRFLTPPTNPNMTIFASKGLPSEIYDECHCWPHVCVSSVFLTVKKSAQVSPLTWPRGSDQQLLRITCEFWPAFMLWKHSTKTDAGSPIWSKCTHLLRK